MATAQRSIKHHSAQEPPIHRVALYARVSTLNGQNPEMQLVEMRQYATARGWIISGEYVDLGVSGARESRPELNRMLSDAKQRACDAILCWKLDRLGRSLKHLVTTIEELQAYRVAFVSLRDNLDLSTPSGRLMLHIIAAMAEFERSLIRERINAGIANARRRGVRMGRPHVYVSGDRVKAMREAGVRWEAISDKLGVSISSAVRALAKVSS